MAELSPLRRRMIEDMAVRNLSPATQRSYLHAVEKFSRHFARSPDRLGLEDVRAFQVHLVSTGISWAALNQTVCALRLFYGVTLGLNMPYLRHSSVTNVPASASFRMPMICSSEKRFRFIRPPFQWVDLRTQLKKTKGQVMVSELVLR